MPTDKGNPSGRLYHILTHPVPWLMVLGFVLRFWNLGFGLPYIYHPDEHRKAEVVQRLVHFEKPDYFLHPGLMVNTTAIACRGRMLLGVEYGKRMAIRTGRFVTLLFGVASIWAIYILGKLVGGRRVGVFSAAMLAFTPVHVIHSRYLKEDVYLVFAVLLVAIAGLVYARATDEGRARRWLYILACFCGVCVAAKFVGLLMIPAALALIGWRERTWRPAVTGGVILLGVAAAVFVLISPQVLDFRTAAVDFAAEVHRGYHSSHRPELRLWEWPDLGTYYFRTALLPGMGWLAPIVGLIAVPWALRRRMPLEYVWCASLAVGWYVLIEFSPAKRGADVERYALPSVPFLTILAGVIATRYIRSPARLYTAMGCLLVPPAIFSVVLTSGMVPDTRDIARDWMAKHGPVKPGEVLVLSAMYPDGVPHGSTIIDMSLERSLETLQHHSGRADWMTASSFYTDRYTNFPHLSGKYLERLNYLREVYPHVHIVEKPWYFRAGFQNPTVEIRSKHPFRNWPAE